MDARPLWREVPARAGRTGRAGSKGEAISLCASHERYYLEQIEKLADIKINRREWNYDDFGNLLQLERSMHRKKGKRRTDSKEHEANSDDSPMENQWERGRGKKKKKKNKRKRQSKVITMDDISPSKNSAKYAPKKRTLD